MKPMPQPCVECSWRISNQGKPHPHGWYSLKNLRRLWAGLRSGRAPGMTCHPTDPNNLVPAGHRAASEKAETKECAGALLLVQRELKLLEKAPKEYLKGRRGGVTRMGAHFWITERCLFAGTIMGGDPIPVIAEDGDIGLPWSLDTAKAAELTK